MYLSTELKSEISISKIITIHYFSYTSTFIFPGERHDFWEFVYVDNGDIELQYGNQWLTLHKGEILFHPPGEFHSLRSNGVKAPNLVVVAFICESPAVYSLADKVIPVSGNGRECLQTIIAEARTVFSNPLNDPTTHFMSLRNDMPFGAQQMILLSLERFLIGLVRSTLSEQAQSLTPKYINRVNDDEITLHKLDQYFKDHIASSLTIKKICSDNLVGYSRLKSLYRKNYHCSLIEYFSRMKLKYAKQLIREDRMNISEIADALGYSSVGYFSRLFKAKFGMSPTEYASTILALSDRAIQVNDN